MKTTVIHLFSFLVFSGFSSLVYAQTIVNDGFEIWTSECPVNTAPSSWTNFSVPEGLGPDQAGDCIGEVTSFQGSSHMNLVWSDFGIREGTKQAMVNLTIGETYQVNFYAIHDQGLWAETGPVILDFYHNSTVIFSTPELLNGGAWTLFTTSFIALASTDTIGFQVAPGSSGTSGSVGVDAVSISIMTSVHDTAEGVMWSIYPNPCTDMFTINSPGDFQNVTVYNALGECQIFQEVDGNGVVVDMTHVPAGIYWAKVTLRDGRVQCRSFVRN